jgi:hypothetical protein
MTKDDKAISAKSHKKSDPKKRRRRRVETFNSYIYKVRAALRLHSRSCWSLASAAFHLRRDAGE